MVFVCLWCFLILCSKQEPAPAPAPTPATGEQNNENIATETEKSKEQVAEVDPHAVTPRSQVNLEATATGEHWNTDYLKNIPLHKSPLNSWTFTQLKTDFSKTLQSIVIFSKHWSSSILNLLKVYMA